MIEEVRMPTETPHPAMPSVSTVASIGLGVPAAVVISWVLNTFVLTNGLTVPGSVESALGALISAMVGYFFRGGRASQT